MTLKAVYKAKHCATCGKPFQPYNARQKYCSASCKMGTGVCQQCGQAFVKKGNTTGTFCSPECWYEWPGRIAARCFAH